MNPRIYTATPLPADEALQGQIQEALLWDNRVSSRVIGVEVANRIVTLRGTPQSYRRILAAIEIVSAFPRCRGIVNQLKLRSVRQMCDFDIADLVREILTSQEDLSNHTITVAVHDGVVTLRGTVTTLKQGLTAEDVAIGIGGVRTVRNLLLCDLTEQVEDERISRDLETVLRSTPGLRGAKLHVAFNGESLVLSGHVAEPWQRELALNVVEQFRPMHVTSAITTAD